MTLVEGEHAFRESPGAIVPAHRSHADDLRRAIEQEREAALDGPLQCLYKAGKVQWLILLGIDPLGQAIHGAEVASAAIIWRPDATMEYQPVGADIARGVKVDAVIHVEYGVIYHEKNRLIVVGTLYQALLHDARPVGDPAQVRLLAHRHAALGGDVGGYLNVSFRPSLDHDVGLLRPDGSKAQAETHSPISQLPCKVSPGHQIGIWCEGNPVWPGMVQHGVDPLGKVHSMLLSIQCQQA